MSKQVTVNGYPISEEASQRIWEEALKDGTKDAETIANLLHEFAIKILNIESDYIINRRKQNERKNKFSA